MDKVVHFEVPADDVARAQKFYEKCFGWGINVIPGMKYTLLMTGPSVEGKWPEVPGFINGGMLQRQAPITHVVITIGVQDMNAAMKNVKAAGGEVIKEPFAVGDIGISAYVKDTEGNVIGVWQELKKQQEG